MRARTLTASLLGALAATAVLAAPAPAAFELKDTGLSFREAGPAGEPGEGPPAIGAGTHPFEVTTTLAVSTREEGGKEVPEAQAKNLTVQLPAGFVGARDAVPYCSAAEFVDRDVGRSGCPDASAVGIAALKLASEAIDVGSGDVFLHVPVYSLAPPPGVTAQLGFVALDVPVTISVGLSDSPPYRLEAKTTNISQALLFYDAELSVWGDPSDPAHDRYRGGCLGEYENMTEAPVSLGSCGVKIPRKPFLTLPRVCAPHYSAVFEVNSWQDPTTFFSTEATTLDDSTPPQPIGTSGCEGLGFSPQIATQPTGASAESPIGLDVTLQVDDPGIGAVGGSAHSDLKEAVVTLPEGVTVNPSAAEGLGTCDPAQYAAESLAATGCPESSKLGTVAVTTPLLEEELPGSLYQATPDDPATATPGSENPFDALLALYIVIKDPRNGVLLKMAGQVEPDPATGRLRTRFADLPQVPFSSFRLHFREGPRSPLVSPPRCGTYTTTALFTPWARPTQPIERTATFTLSSGVGGAPCPPAGVPGFDPGFSAGTLSNSAGSHSPVLMRITRKDGEQDITRFSATLPPGVSGKIAGIPPCPEAAIALAPAKSGRQELAAPSCPPASRVGHVLVGAGVGPSLTYVPGTIYLGGPFAGHPLSVVVITPAVAGPFDAGTVVTRVALDLDPTTAQVSVDGSASDPIPHILKGIPLKVRDLRVFVDRPGFTLNATSCDAMEIGASITGSFADPLDPADDAAVPRSARYQAADCSRLAFKPKLDLRLTGATRRSGNPALHAELRSRAGDANLRGAVVVLPPSQFIDNAHISNPCTRVQFAAEACPESSILGYARAFTPLLDEPLEGPVYFRSNGGERNLPDLVADLRGQFRFELVIAILKSKNARVRTKVLNAPDAPVSRFVLSMAGGRRGLLENSSNLCRQKQRANLVLTGQNSKRITTRSVIKTSCKAKQAKRSSHRRR
ncbi:MAG: hypothetical protein JJE35_04870 [Thermoleophilia bacterium]|nr:hypothetical protein [Thermoleophilia bacterium]